MDFEPPVLRPIVWIGNSKRNIQAFPEAVRKLIGDELRFLQYGEMPQIGYHVFKVLESKNLKQREIAILLGSRQPEVSHLMNGHFSRFTTDKLLEFLKKLNQKVTIEIRPRAEGEAYQQVSYGA